jgi:hypothetical protein
VKTRASAAEREGGREGEEGRRGLVLGGFSPHERMPYTNKNSARASKNTSP